MRDHSLLHFKAIEIIRLKSTLVLAPHFHSGISAADPRTAVLDAGTAEDDDEWEDVDDGLRGAHPFLNGVIYPDARTGMFILRPDPRVPNLPSYLRYREHYSDPARRRP
ncbi:hypothetical protein B0H14DRAFT_3428047 [Mycena olivaceomarginata]|nr:hypothetical protein B0H14DRAFT_3428047 [Mycena olivaceomarginata]